ncbi:tail assembly chaperone [Carnobacterium jeotgali]|uniref:tail assembly chaperone n=1 Tax=Carnobacterium jeotgali TaxID=545534 RepID=UPI00388F352D
MILEIAGKDVQIVTGVRFIRELDKRFKLEVENGLMKLGFGLNQVAMDIDMENPNILVDLIECGVAGNKGFKPNTQQIEAFIDEQEDYTELFELFDKEMAESNATKKKWLELQENSK